MSEFSVYLNSDMAKNIDRTNDGGSGYREKKNKQQ